MGEIKKDNKMDRQKYGENSYIRLKKLINLIYNFEFNKDNNIHKSQNLRGKQTLTQTRTEY